MKQKNIDTLKSVRNQLDEKSYNEDDWKFINFVFDELENGKADVACHTRVHSQDFVGSFIDAEEVIDSKECYNKRHLCYDIGKLLSWKTTKIKGTCGKYTSCRDKKLIGDDWQCGCETEKTVKFNKYHYDNSYDDTTRLFIIPWTCTVGVRFIIPNQPQDHTLSRYFKTLGPRPLKRSFLGLIATSVVK